MTWKPFIVIWAVDKDAPAITRRLIFSLQDFDFAYAAYNSFRGDVAIGSKLACGFYRTHQLVTKGN